MNRKLRTVWLTESPGPNIRDFFDALARRPDIEASVLYCTRRHAEKWHGSGPRATGQAEHFLFNLNPRPIRWGRLQLNPGAWTAALAGRHDLFVICGYNYLTALSTLLFQTAARHTTVMWGEMIDRRPTPWSLALKRRFVHPLLRRLDAVLTMGPKGIQSHRAIGIPADRIHELPYTCDLSPYLAVDRESRNSPSGTKRIIVTGQLIPRKRVDLAVSAFVNLAEKHADWELAICGDGPCRDDLERLVPDRLRSRVSFLGFVPKSKQPEAYGSGHIFLLASREDGWGMVVPEAMASGLPVITTTAVESARVLLEDGLGGILVGPNDGSAITSALDSLMSDPQTRKRMGIAARGIAQRYDAPEIAAVCANILWTVHDRLKNKQREMGAKHA